MNVFGVDEDDNDVDYVLDKINKQQINNNGGKSSPFASFRISEEDKDSWFATQ